MAGLYWINIDLEGQPVGESPYLLIVGVEWWANQEIRLKGVDTTELVLKGTQSFSLKINNFDRYKNNVLMNRRPTKKTRRRGNVTFGLKSNYSELEDKMRPWLASKVIRDEGDNGEYELTFQLPREYHSLQVLPHLKNIPPHSSPRHTLSYSISSQYQNIEPHTHTHTQHTHTTPHHTTILTTSLNLLVISQGGTLSSLSGFPHYPQNGLEVESWNRSHCHTAELHSIRRRNDFACARPTEFLSGRIVGHPRPPGLPRWRSVGGLCQLVYPSCRDSPSPTRSA